MIKNTEKEKRKNDKKQKMIKNKKRKNDKKEKNITKETHTLL
jgi:hypothetical protein